jgi:N-acyl-D-aspartate/D-glutamate deacylase
VVNAVVRGDVLLKDGLIQAIGKIPRKVLEAAGKDLVEFDAKGGWVTPGSSDPANPPEELRRMRSRNLRSSLTFGRGFIARP